MGKFLKSKYIILLLPIIFVSVLSAFYFSRGVLAENESSEVGGGGEEVPPEYKIKADLSSDKTKITLSVEKGTHTVVYKINGVEAQGVLTKDTPLEIYTGYQNGSDKIISINATLTASENNEYVGGLQTFNYRFEPTTTLAANPSLEAGGACYNFINGDYKNMSTEDQLDFKNRVPYCFQENVSTVYLESTIEDVINTAVSVIQNSKIPTIILGDDLDTKYADFIEDPTKSIALTCDTFAGTTECNEIDGKVVCRENEYAEKNTKQYYTDKKVLLENDTCRTFCKEVVTVSYGAPVAAQAGACFEYKVQVRSSVSCTVENKKPNPPTPPEVCNPYPVCNSYTGFVNQGGPSEDFDKCISTCGNGEYSQDCIDKCYEKVYEKEENNNNSDLLGMKNEISTNTVKRLTNSNTCPSTNLNAYGGADGLADAVYKYYQKNKGGHYSWSDNKIVWNSNSSTSGCYWDKYAKYYFSTPELAQRTVYGDENVNKVWKYDNLGPYKPKDGFKVAVNCREDCQFTGCSSGSLVDEEQAMEDYETALYEYNKDLAECSSAVKCNDKIAIFTMTVNNSTGEVKTCEKDENTDYCFTWTAKHPQDKGPELITGDTEMILGVDSNCATGTTGKDDYFTEMSFPGSWQNLKNGDITYIPTDKTGWKEHENEFCLPLNAKSVNKDWWNWDQVYNRDLSKKSTVNEKEIEYNITAKVRKFGLFLWKFDVSCFYATNNTPPPPPGDEVTIDSFATRSASLKNLFVNKDLGYNWSFEATNLSNSNYVIAPTALKTKIEKQKDNIYTDNSELDYSIKISKDQIKTIKNEIKNDEGSYTKWTGDTTKEENSSTGINYYTSIFLREKTDVKKSPVVYGCNNLRANGKACDNLDNYVSEDIQIKAATK